MNIGQRTTSDNYEMEFGHIPITVKVTHMKFMAKSRNIRLVFVGHNCMILVDSDESFSQGPWRGGLGKTNLWKVYDIDQWRRTPSAQKGDTEVRKARDAVWSTAIK